MESTYRIVLADGTEIRDLRMNGSNFVSDEPISESTFRGKLSPVTIYHEETPEVHPNMDLVQIVQMGQEYWFILRDLTRKEMEEIQIRADIDFIAMMSDIEL